MDLNQLSGQIIGAAIEVHKLLGPGLLESTYQTCLEYELKKLGLSCKTQVGQPLAYKDLFLENGYRMDMLVDDKVIVELKSIEKINEVHIAQTLTYLKLSEKPLALLINFNVPRLTDGLKRFVSRKN